MSWLDGIRHRLRTVLRPGDYEREILDEQRFHQDLDTQHTGDASASARRFGNRTWYQEEVRRMTWLIHLDALRQDAAYAWRSMCRSPGFAVMVVVTLALGIGLNAATFSVVDQLYLRPPPGVAEPDDIRRVWIESFRVAGKTSSTREAMNYPMVRAAAEAYGDTSRFAAVTAIHDYRLGGTRKGPLVDVTFAPHNYFALLGVRPALGRFYGPEEDQAGVPRVAVLSHGTWSTHLGSDSSIVGRTILLDTMRVRVVGVAPPGFTGIDLEPAHAWLPLRSYPQVSWLRGQLFESERMYIFSVFYRRAPGVPDAAFQREAALRLREVSRRQWAMNPDTLLNVFTGPVLEARGPGDEDQEYLLSTRLTGVALIVLLIAFANVVNLLLARAMARRREVAIRLAMGISRGRLIRLLISESILLALVAAGAALLAASWGGAALRGLLLPDIEWSQNAMHWRVVVVSLAAALVAGAGAGLIPAIQFSRPRLTPALKDGTEHRLGGRSTIRNGMLVVQTALSVTLLVGAGLFLRSLDNVRGIDIGYDSARIIYGRVAFEPGQAPPLVERAARIRAVEERLRSRPGVEGTARAGHEPMRGLSFFTFYWGADSSQGIRKDFPTVNAVSRDFFAAVGLRFVRGAPFASGEAARQQVVVNEAMAAQLWPGVDAMGQCIRFRSPDAECHRVVGVVETAAQSKVIETPQPQYYLPLGTPASSAFTSTALVVRVAPGATAVASRETAAILQQEFPAGYPVITPMTEYLDPEYRPWRLGATLFAGSGLLALLVALVGVYSSLAYAVSQRTREFGVRIAVGARAADVLRLVLDQGMRVVLVGVLVGTAIALAAGPLVAAMLFGVAPRDPSILLFVSCTVLIAAAAATLIPAWRAARVDPVIALRAD